MTGSTLADLARHRNPIQWDWPGWLPRGYLTILVSPSGVGKSNLALRIAASYMAGLPWPDGTKFTVQRGLVLWVEGEDSYEIHLDRMLRWGLDPAQIVLPLANSRATFRPGNLQHAKAMVDKARRSDVRLVVFDSLGGLLSHSSGAYTDGQLVADLARLAGNIQKPVLLIHHLRKLTVHDRQGQPSTDRIRGSSVIVQLTRVIWELAVPDMNDPGNLRLSVIKNNLAPFPDPIGVRIGADGLHFGPPPQPPPPPPPRLSQQDRAAAFLKDLLAAGPVPAKQVKAQGQAAGLSGPTLDRAKKQLGITPRKSGKAWYWHLPPPE